jgi:hypothetical protein
MIDDRAVVNRDNGSASCHNTTFEARISSHPRVYKIFRRGVYLLKGVTPVMQEKLTILMVALERWLAQFRPRRPRPRLRRRLWPGRVSGPSGPPPLPSPRMNPTDSSRSPAISQFP